MMQYQTRRKAVLSETREAQVQKNPSQQTLLSSLRAPSVETLGRQVDLPGAIREKMETAFGADLSGVQLYESRAVADAGAEAIAMGGKIGFAPGKLDFASSGGQTLLGHELSHVVSQARGEVTGSGFLNDHALEVRADREGAMAAAGESVYTGPVTPLSPSMPAAGPMQAKKNPERMAAGIEDMREWTQIFSNTDNHTGDKEFNQKINDSFAGADRHDWRQAYVQQYLASARALNQVAGEQGREAAYTSEQSDHFRSLQELKYRVGGKLDRGGFVNQNTKIQQARRDRSFDKIDAMLSGLSGEDAEQIRMAETVMSVGHQEQSKEQREAHSQLRTKRAEALRKRKEQKRPK